MAEVELNHTNSSNSGTHTSRERLHWRRQKMQKRTKNLHPREARWLCWTFIAIITCRIVTGGCVMLWKLLLSACFDNVIPLFSPSRHIWAFISVNQRKLSGPDTIKNTAKNHNDWSAIRVNKSQAQIIFIKGHFDAFTQSKGWRSRWK